ncbi:carboxylesterase [Karstenula rhodostoma CBS 690.94]|uniref:Carboxylic ester hydrolase n=1 Tax=Karstenula rhodostoma CBS 690.94 TaxID=1392251 RepID=A0A9P4PIX1_9PLEO|nr:carboxylesterase [Karstenula rhodostoma CBS 690.94]
MRSYLLLSLSLSWIARGHYTSYPRKDTRVTLPCGTLVNGLVDANLSSVRQFLGIRYAQPPVGDLRWEPPLANKLSSPVNATAYGRSCTQPEPLTPNLENTDIPELAIQNKDTGEDCLTLSLWTPTNATKLPVVIFFYGGGWYTGGQDVPYTIPTQWVQRTKDLIVVKPNSRGNIFGYPNAEGATNQNLGMLDQRLAVEWVRDNIEAFGGDSSKITIWGQSSGAEQVDYYNFAWHEDPIVQGLIMNSGTAFIEDGSGPKYSNFSYVATQVGCGNQTGAAAELACMKKVDAAKIEKVIADNMNGGGVPPLAFGSSADEKIVPSNLTKWALEGKIAKVPAIIGIDQNEGVGFVTYNADGPSAEDQVLADFWFQTLFLCPSFKTSKLRAAAGLPTYRYMYVGNFSNISPRPWMGAYHGSEQPMQFGTHGNYRGASTPYQIAVSEAMQDAYRAFINDPLSGLKGEDWPTFTEDSGVVRWFASNGTVARNAVGELQAWEEKC